MGRPIAGFPNKVQWPTGRDGPLLITGNSTMSINAGSIWDWSSIQIDAGSTLNINTSNSPAWTFLGCTGNCLINGIIQGIQGNHTGGTATSNLPLDGFQNQAGGGTLDGASVSYTIAQAAGGAGGSGGLTSSGAAAGGIAGVNGGGGGGGGGIGASGSVTPGAGGTGGTNGGNASSIGANGGGAGGTGGVTGGNGTNGGSTVIGSGAGGTANIGGGGGAGGGPSASSRLSGGGGGGGGRGFHGQGIYLKVLGIVSGSGSINASGQTGGTGGNGSNGQTNGGVGGGGGGGAGGSGGKVIVAALSTYTSALYNRNVFTGGADTGDNQISGPFGSEVNYVTAKFTPVNSGILLNIIARLRNDGTTLGNVFLTLRADNSGNPNSSIIATSNTIAVSTIGSTANDQTFAFPTNPVLTGGVTYWAVLTGDSTFYANSDWNINNTAMEWSGTFDGIGVTEYNEKISVDGTTWFTSPGYVAGISVQQSSVTGVTLTATAGAGGSGGTHGTSPVGGTTGSVNGTTGSNGSAGSASTINF